jgi:hypothetical protein
MPGIVYRVKSRNSLQNELIKIFICGERSGIILRVKSQELHERPGILFRLNVQESSFFPMARNPQ